ncbi:7456_t:CDS:1, partial [Dentiscutata heterogama]
SLHPTFKIRLQQLQNNALTNTSILAQKAVFIPIQYITFTSQIIETAHNFNIAFHSPP